METTSINISGDNNGTINNTTHGSIQSINIVNQNNKDIINLIENIKKLINNEEIENDIKEGVIDDLEIIQTEIESENPKQVKLKKALKGIKDFAGKLPSMLPKAVLIVTQLGELIEKLKSIVANYYI